MITNFKELGNEYFKSADYSKALEMYKEGLKSKDLPKDEKLNFYKNKSMCYMKLSRFNDVVEACNEALSLSEMDIKSLYRRSVANMHLSKLSEAHSDAKKLLILDCKNKLYQSHIVDLETKIKLQIEDSNSFVGKVNTMFNVLKKDDSTEEIKLKSLNNLAVLIRESSNNHIWSHPDRHLLMDCSQITNPNSIIEAAQRCLSLLFLPSIERTLEVFKQHSPQYFANMIYSSNGEQCRLAGHYLENILSGLTQIKAYRDKSVKYETEMKEKSNSLNYRPYPKYQLDGNVDTYVSECLQTLLLACNSKRLSASGRDSILEILVRFVPSKEGINWSRTLLHSEGGLTRLLEVGAAAHRVDTAGGQTAQSSEISLISTSHKTKMTVAILLAHIYDDLVSDKDRDLFRDKCCDFVLDLLTDEIIESKVEAANLIGLLFQGPYEAGSAVLSKSGILEGLLLLIRSEIASYQRIALDAIVLACTKKDKCLAIVNEAVPILEDIYRTGSDAMKVRALVGMCKLGSAGGRDSSITSLAAGSNLELAKSCRKFLRDGCQAAGGDSGDSSVLRWASEGLAYLTLDADVKEALVEDEAAIKNLLAVTKNSGLECLYPVATVLANLTNSYDKPEILPEMLELAKYAKQHVPETHPKDSDRHSRARLDALMRLGLAGALHELAALTRTSPGSQAASGEFLARLYLSAAAVQGHRGALIQAGGGKALLGLALPGSSNTAAGQVLAAQALARLAISMDPRIAFPGQRSLEVVRPLLQLLHIDNTGLQNYESLLALTNLASLDDSHRRRIVKEKGVSQIEYYMFEEHEMLRRAATECMCNLVSLEEVREKFLGEENDRVKLLVLFCAEAEDVALIKAASGALASLSSDPRCLDKITKVNNWFEIIQTMLACPEPEIQHRAIFTLDGLISNAGLEFCQFIASSNMLEVLMVLSKMQNEPGLAAAASCADHSLQVLAGHHLIKPV